MAVVAEQHVHLQGHPIEHDPMMGRRPTISRAAAAAAALAIIDEDGLPGLSLEAVARQLGVRAPSLYNHFADRDDLLGEVARLVMAASSEGWPPIDPSDWRASLEERSMVVRRNVLAHPNAAPLLLQVSHRKVYAEQARRWDTYLEGCGLTKRELTYVREGLSIITYGAALLDAAEITGSRAASTRSAREREVRFRATVRTFLRHALEGLDGSGAPGPSGARSRPSPARP